ncbi:RtcB family protein [Xanthobacter sp. VTT E-85241]|uniref:RtcB family protein n=1 Tax=Roseixanthobacter finlandensis TaxID=3119922 RepID=UPI0037266052
MPQASRQGDRDGRQWGRRSHHQAGSCGASAAASDPPSATVRPLYARDPRGNSGGRSEYCVRPGTHACSFAPHGAGRNMSRTALLKKLGIHGLPPDRYHAAASDIVAAQTEGLDVRFFYGRPDPSESPLAYKSAASVRAQIEHYGLADVIATIEPLGCLMAGDYDKPWQRKRNPAD